MHIILYQLLKEQQYGSRITVKSSSGSLSQPVFIVIRQFNNVLSWRVPVKINNEIYNETSRTLCPFQCEKKSDTTSDELSNYVVARISTNSEKKITFDLNIDISKDYYLR